MITLQDIAEVAGVSVSTVSRVMSNKGKISTHTKDKILSVARDLRFKKGLVEQTSVDQNCYSIGMILPAEGEYYHNDPASSLDIRMIRNAFEQKGHQVDVILNEEKEIKSLIKPDWNGLILSDTNNDPEWLSQMKNISIPFILVNGVIDGTKASYVDYDNYKAMKTLTTTLLNEDPGRNTIVLAGPKQRSVTQNRFQGLKSAYKKRELTLPPVIFGEFSLDSGYHRMKEILNQNTKIQQVICFSDYIAMGAIKAIKEAGKKVPEEIGVSGFDDIEIASYFDPPLTTVKRYQEGFAPLVVRTLTNLITYPGSLESIQVFLKTDILIRKSTMQ